MKHPPTRGEIWLIQAPGMSELDGPNDRLAVVVSSPVLDTTPMRIIVPLSKWQPSFSGMIDKFRIAATRRNGLDTAFVAEFLQVSNVSTDCLVRRIGLLDADQVEEIVAGIVIAIDYWPQKSAIAQLNTVPD